MEGNKPNNFVRSLIVILCIGLTVLISYSFFKVEPKGELNSGLLVLLSFLVVLVLSESFDNFSVGKLISISKEVKKKENENKELVRKNEQLINQIISISNTQNQSQSHTNVYGDFYTETNKKPQKVEANQNDVQALLDVIGDSLMIREVEESIIKDLEARSLSHDSDSEKVLIRHLAGTKIVLEFEKIYNAIFGSQIKLLKELNASIPHGKSESEIFNGVDKVLQKFPNVFSDWTKEQYLGFLYEMTLVTKNETYNTVHITVRGVEFLTWLTRSGLPEEKSF